MAKKLSPEVRKKIHESTGPYREIAKECSVSLATVARWKNYEAGNKGRNRDCFGVISEFQKAVFRECSRVTRYPCKTLIEFLAPVWRGLPSSHVLENLSSPEAGHCKGVKVKSRKKLNKPVVLISLRTLYRILDKERKGGRLHSSNDKKPPPEGTLVLHSVGVKWFEASRDGGPTPLSVEGEVLCIFERLTGMAYLKVYRGAMSAESVVGSIRKFRGMCPLETKTVKLLEFYTEREPAGWRSTVLRDPESGILGLFEKYLNEEPSVSFDAKTITERPDQILLPKC